MGLLTPLLFLLVLGTGPDSATAGTQGYRTHLSPGVMPMAVQTPATAVGASIIGFGAMGVGFVVAGEAAMVHEPAEGPFDHPASRDHLAAFEKRSLDVVSFGVLGSLSLC
jgi:pseudouridine-5'-phosphate glycosidase